MCLSYLGPGIGRGWRRSEEERRDKRREVCRRRADVLPDGNDEVFLEEREHLPVRPINRRVALIIGLKDVGAVIQ